MKRPRIITRRVALDWSPCAFRVVRADVYGYTVTVERFDVGARLRVRRPYTLRNERGREYITAPLADVGFRSVADAQAGAFDVVAEIAGRVGVAQADLFPNP
jgi:hypothetical protein